MDVLDPEALASFAKSLYEEYIRSSGGKAWNGLPCPPWELLGEPVQNHWMAVAAFAVKEVLASLTFSVLE